MIDELDHTFLALADRQVLHGKWITLGSGSIKDATDRRETGAVLLGRAGRPEGGVRSLFCPPAASLIFSESESCRRLQSTVTMRNGL
jgi:hypothetical protein